MIRKVDDGGKALARPALEMIEARLHVRFLPRLVIFAADDEQIVLFAIRRELQASVVVGIFRVPVERVGDGAARHVRSDDVRAIRRLLGVHGEEIVDRRVRAHDEVVGRHLHIRLLDRHRRASVLRLRVLHVRAAEDAPARGNEGFRQCREVEERMKARLVGKAQTLAGVERRDRRARDLLDDDPREPRGIVLRVEHVGRVSFGEKEIAIESGEAALDVVRVHEVLDEVDRGGV